MTDAPERIYAIDHNELFGNDPWHTLASCRFQRAEPDATSTDYTAYLRLDIHEREVRELREVLRDALGILHDPMWEHSSPECPDYNECDKDPCKWCSDAKQLLDRAREALKGAEE